MGSSGGTDVRRYRWRGLRQVRDNGDSMQKTASSALKDHVANQWPDHKISEEQWTHGPVSRVMPASRVLVAVPKRSDQPCVYVTCGTSEVDVGGGYGLEFFVYSRSPDPRHVELVSMVAYMHRHP